MKTMGFVFGGLFLLLTVALHAGMRESAFQARKLLGPDVWSRILLIENSQAGPRGRYPSELYALVFEFEGILWFYTGLDGTQSLSLYGGRLVADQSDLGPLLRAVEPGVTSFTDVTDQPLALVGEPAGQPPRACFLACVSFWKRLQHEKEQPSRARLISFYQKSLLQGHTLLEFWRGGRRLVFDPEEPTKLGELSLRLPDDPLDVVYAIYPYRQAFRLSKAIYFELGPDVLLREKSYATIQTVVAFWNRDG